MMNRAVERGVEPVIFTGARDSKGAQKSEIDFILGHILVFLGPEKCGISTNLGPCVEVYIYEFGAQKGQKNFIGAPNFFYRGPSTLSTALMMKIVTRRN
jgi:hypothetical protein